MRIMQLRREDIPLVTKGGNQALIDELTTELDKAEQQNCVIYVRYGPRFLQRLRVNLEALSKNPMWETMLIDEEMWKHQEPNQNARGN